VFALSAGIFLVGVAFGYVGQLVMERLERQMTSLASSLAQQEDDISTLQQQDLQL